MEEYKTKYEFMIRFIYHEYLASISTFEGLASIAEKNEDPLVIHYKNELQKFRKRLKEIEGRFVVLSDFRHPD